MEYDLSSATMSLRRAQRIAIQMGARVFPKRGTGEIVFEFLGVGRVVHNNRRKDCSRALMGFLRDLQDFLRHEVRRAA